MEVLCVKRILFVLIFAIFTVSIFAGLSGKVAEVDKYGNTYTDLLQDSATEAGITGSLSHSSGITEMSTEGNRC